MKTERLDVFTEQGHRVAVWRSTGERGDGPVIVASAGYARTMRSLGAIALCLVRNGCTVYRFDSANHLGLSDGDIVDFNLEDLSASFRAVIDLARETEGVRSVRLIALSIAAAAAFEITAGDSDIDRILLMSGVVDGVRTLEQACGVDYSVYVQTELPPVVHVEGHDVEPTRLWGSMQPGGLLTAAVTADLLRRIPVPVVNFVATGDDWVKIEDCREAFRHTRENAPRVVVELPFNGHDMSKNPAAITSMLTELTRFSLAPAGALGDSSAETDVVFPGFEELLQTRTSERDRALTEAATPAVRQAG